MTKVSEHNGTLMKAATKAALGVALVLIAAKAYAYVVTDSVSILGSLMDSSLDLLASFINFLAVRMALEPADENHRFGHGKAEPIAGFFQAGVIMGSCVFLLLQSGQRLLHHDVVEAPEAGIYVSVFAIIATLCLVLFQQFVIRRTKSVAIEADSLHYSGDILLNLSVIAALWLGPLLNLLWLDAVFGIVIAVIVGSSALKIGRSSIRMLMDEEFGPEDRENIGKIVKAHPQVMGFHDLRTRKSGLTGFIQLHVVMDRKLDLLTAHDYADQVEELIRSAYPNVDVIIHVDPDGIMEHHTPLEKQL